jgi:hypothetical protein
VSIVEELSNVHTLKLPSLGECVNLYSAQKLLQYSQNVNLAVEWSGVTHFAWDCRPKIM